MQEVVQSRYFKGSLVAVGVLLVAFVSFAGGLAIGLHKAKFSYAWGENYERNFVGGNKRMMSGVWGGMMDRDDFIGKLEGRNFRSGHGISGKVLSVSDSSLVIADRNNEENTVAVTDKTLIKRNGADVKIGDIQKDDRAVIIGSPSEDGTVNADFIRVFSREN